MVLEVSNVNVLLRCGKTIHNRHLSLKLSCLSISQSYLNCFLNLSLNTLYGDPGGKISGRQNGMRQKSWECVLIDPLFFVEHYHSPTGKQWLAKTTK